MCNQRPRVRTAVTTALISLALVVLAGCGGSTPTAPKPAPDKLTIVAAFYPLQFLAGRIAGDRAEVVGLTEPGAEPHDLELTPKQVAAIGSADVVLYEKTFQSAVDEAVAQSGNPHALDVTSVVPLRDRDPHIWLDPLNLNTIATAVRDQLTARDPDHAAAYTANTDTLIRDLTSLDAEFREGLASCRRTAFITTHAAFGYLARRYGLEQIGISGISPDAEPSPARIAEVQRIARQRQVTTIFTETLVSPALARSIAGDLGLKTDVLDPIEGITPESRGSDYLSVMRANLTALRGANGCQ